MNKIIIPSILAATILVAGMFAFMPVQKASTVHTTIQSTILQSVAKSDTDVATGDALTLTCTAPFVVHAINVDADGTLATDTVDVDFDPDGAGTVWDLVANFVSAVDLAATPDIEILALSGENHGPLAGLASGTVSVVINLTADTGDEAIRAQFLATSTGTCS